MSSNVNAAGCARGATGDVTCANPAGSAIGDAFDNAMGSTSSGAGITASGGPFTLPVDTKSKPGGKIATCANKLIGQSTADVPATQGGNLGCALAVSRMLDCAGYGVGTHVSTIELYKALEKDDCYEEVDDNRITATDAMNLQPGDIPVTQWRKGKAGHTGVYYGNGNMISNTSKSYKGSKPGTIQQNYSVKDWDEGVTTRNPKRSAIFRRKDIAGCQ